MINELLSYKRSLSHWGIEIPKTLHRFMNANSKKEKSFKVSIGLDGIRKIQEFDEFPNLFCIKKGNHHSALSFKYNRGDQDKLLKSVNRHLAFHIELSEKFSEKPEIKPFHRLVSYLKKIESLNFMRQINDLLDEAGHTGSVYLSLDVLSGTKIQTPSFMEIISGELFACEEQGPKPEGTDLLGNSLVDADKVIPKAKADIGEIPLYSRNEHTACFERYGMNSVYAAPLGSESQLIAKGVLEFTFSSENRATKDGGIWYSFSPSSEHTYYVLTSLYPRDNIFESNTDDVTPEDWDRRIREVVKMLGAQQGTTNFPMVGEVITLRKLKGAWHVSAHMKYPLSKIADHVQRWHEGTLCGSTLVPYGGRHKIPSLYQFAKQINKQWSRTSSPNKPPDHQDFDSPRINIHDVYRLLFDDDNAINECCRIFATYIIPMLNNLEFFDKKPYERNFYFPMRNLILHKKGFIYDPGKRIMTHESDSSKTWPFWAGKAMQDLNWIYKQFFVQRGQDAPHYLIGQRFSQAVFTNPRLGFSQFIVASRPCLNWAENKDGEVEKHLRFYKRSINKMIECLDELPPVTPAVDPSVTPSGVPSYVFKMPTIPKPEHHILINAGYFDMLPSK